MKDLVPEKSRKGNWTRLRKMGDWGENWLEGFLNNKGLKIHPLNFYSMADRETRERFWKELKAYPKIPDFIAKYGDDVILFDAKTKTRFPSQPTKYYVNIRDYEHYLRFLDILPVWIFFIVLKADSVKRGIETLTDSDVIEVRHHIVRQGSYPKKFIEHDKNWCYDLKQHLDRQWL